MVSKCWLSEHINRLPPTRQLGRVEASGGAWRLTRVFSSCSFGRSAWITDQYLLSVESVLYFVDILSFILSLSHYYKKQILGPRSYVKINIWLIGPLSTTKQHHRFFERVATVALY